MRRVSSIVGWGVSILSLTVLCAALAAGCGDSEGVGAVSVSWAERQSSAAAELPLIDRDVPSDFQTATFAFG